MGLKMRKEIIICIVIVVAIFVGNFVTQKYEKESIESTTKMLEDLKIEFSEKEVKKEDVKDKIDNIHREWDKRHDKLAYFIEHDELEKVETNLTGLRSYIETQEYEEAIKELDEGVFILKHIEEKNKFNLENIF